MPILAQLKTQFILYRSFMKKVVFLCTVLLTLLNCKTLDLKEINLDKAAYEQLPEGLYGNLKTTKGDILVKFNDKESPVTVANFVGLAEGKIENSAKRKENLSTTVLFFTE